MRTADVPSKSWKIDKEKVLELRDKNVNLENGQAIKILHILDCKELADAVALLKNLELEIPNAFVFIISLSCKNFKKIDPLESLKELQIVISKKFTKSNPFILQINDSSSTFSYVYKLSYEKLREVSLIKDSLLDIFKEKRISSDILLSLLMCSLNQADFSTILSFFKVTEINHKIYESAIDSGDELSLHILNLFDFELSESMLKNILLAVIQSKNFNLFLSFFNAFEESQVKDDDIEKVLNFLMNEKTQNIFVLAIETKNIKILNFLLSFHEKFPKFFNFELFKDALNTIIDKEFFEFFPTLESAKFNFSDEEITLKEKEIKKYDVILKEIMKLHQNISNGMKENVIKFVENYPKLRLCYGDFETCALEWSITKSKLEIYCYLRSKGFYSDRGEELELKISRLSCEEKNIIRQHNSKYAVKNPEEFIGILLSKCSFDSQSPIASNDVREMLLNFKDHQEIHSMMKTVSYAKFKTIFDFNSESVRTMDPNGDEFTLGLAYFEQGILYVGKNANKNQRYGTFAHELSHYGLYLIYENKCLPYCKNDTVKKDRWEAVVKSVRQYYLRNPETTDNIIKWVFLCYAPGYQQLAETAVRVNDMLGHYFDNPAKIVELEIQHPELFSFYRTDILADLEITNIYRMIKLNNDFGLLQVVQGSTIQVKFDNTEYLDFMNENKNVILRSNVPQLTLSKLLNEIMSIPGNKLNLKAQNLFVDCEILKQNNLKEEFEELIEDGTVKRMIFSAKKDYLTVAEILKHPGDKFIVIDDSVEQNILDERNLVVKPITHGWNDLTEKSKKVILEKSIKFRNDIFTVSMLFKNPEVNIVGNIFTMLCQNESITVKCDSVTNVSQTYITRSFEKKNKGLKFKDGRQIEEIELVPRSLEEFVLGDTKDDSVVIISDIAGSGKSTVLRKIQEVILVNFPSAFVLFLNLKSYIQEFATVGDDFLQEMCRILKFDDLKKEIFLQKYTNSDVQIFFDGFDEISPKCKETVLKLFRIFLFSDNKNNNKIYITTRTHLEYDLELSLSVIGHKLMALSKEEQIQFLSNIWKEKNPQMPLDFIIKCATLLVEKISKISNVIGLPLIVKGFVDIYEGKIDANFDNEITNLTITNIFKKIFETNFSVLLKRYPENTLEYINKSTGIMKVHKKHAIVHHFDEETASNLCLLYNEKEWTLEDIARAGMGKYDRSDKYEFNHETSAEYLTANVVIESLNIYPDLSETQIRVFISVLQDEKFKITRMFLNEMLENLQNMKCILSSKKICEAISKLEEPKNTLKHSSSEGLSNIFLFTLNLIKSTNVQLYEDVLIGNDDHLTPITLILSKINDENKFKKILNEVLSVDEVARKLLSLEHDNQSRESLYSTLASYGSTSSLKIFFNKITQVLGNSEWRNILSKLVGPNKRVMITHAIVDKSSLDSIKILCEVYQEKLSTEELLDILSVKDQKNCDFFEYLIVEFLNSTEIFDLFWQRMKDLVSETINFHDFFFKNGFLALCESVTNKQEESFKFLYDRVMCKYFNLNEFFKHKIEDGHFFFHHFACVGTPLILEFGLLQLKNNLADEDFKDILKIKNENNQNFAHLLGIEKQDLESVNFLLSYIKDELDNEELKQILYEPDVSNFLPLHFMLFSTAECFSALFLLYEEIFNESEIRDLLRSRVQITRAEQPLTVERNIFEIARTYTFDESVARIFRELTERYE